MNWLDWNFPVTYHTIFCSLFGQKTPKTKAFFLLKAFPLRLLLVWHGVRQMVERPHAVKMFSPEIVVDPTLDRAATKKRFGQTRRGPTSPRFASRRPNHLRFFLISAKIVHRRKVTQNWTFSTALQLKADTYLSLKVTPNYFTAQTAKSTKLFACAEIYGNQSC